MTTDHYSEISKFNLLSIIIKFLSQPGFEPRLFILQSDTLPLRHKDGVESSSTEMPHVC